MSSKQPIVIFAKTIQQQEKRETHTHTHTYTHTHTKQHKKQQPQQQTNKNNNKNNRFTQYNTTLLSLCREICFLARHLHKNIQYS